MRYTKTMAQVLEEMKKPKINEDGHTDVPSMKRLCKVMTDNVMDIEMKLDEMSDEENLDTWLTNKMASCSSSIQSVKDYITNPVDDDSMEESVDLSEAVELPKDKVDMIKGFTDRNQHYDARAYICQMMKDSRLKSIYSEVGALQDKYNRELGYLLSRNVRDQLDKMVLLPKLKRAFKNWNEIYSSI